MSVGIVWFRNDLRLEDNPALYAATQQCRTIIPVFIADNTLHSTTTLGAASRVWLHHSLHALSIVLHQQGLRLLIRQGDALATLQQLIQDTNASHVFWNRCYEPHVMARDAEIKAQLRPKMTVQSFNASLLYEPWQMYKADGTPFKVFTAFWKQMLRQGIDLALQPPLPDLRIKAPTRLIASLNLDDLGLLPPQTWHKTLIHHWQIGEQSAQNRLMQFLQHAAQDYALARDRPDQVGTSLLSPHLHFGEISPRQIIQTILDYQSQHPEMTKGLESFQRELGWREFAYHLLYHQPHTLDQPLDQRFRSFPWRDRADYTADLKRWQQGQTGMPLVDAGMRQLWQTGWMHNRVRMVVASFLTKNLLIPWQEGEAWFRDTLVDADLANNVLGWQWVAGCGADAAPYFRIFNPITQGKNFDPQGDYVRRFVPELQARSIQTLHQVRQLGEGLDYPLPMVDLASSRQRALAAFEQIKVKG